MKKLFAYFFLCISLIALAINISGFLFKLSPSEIKEENLRFENDQIYTYEDALEHIRWTESDTRNGKDDHRNGEFPPDIFGRLDKRHK